MNNLNEILKTKAPVELYEYVSTCDSGEDLVNKLQNDPSLLFPILKNMKLEEKYGSLAARLFYHVSTKDLNNPEVKKVETTLRNNGMLNRAINPDLTLEIPGGVSLEAHKCILTLESSFFMTKMGFEGFEEGKSIMKEMGINPEVYNLVVKYLYLSDEKRVEFVSIIDKILLPSMAVLSDFWGIETLKGYCDDALCNSFAEFKIEKSDINNWLTQSSFLPKFVEFVQFIKKASEYASEQFGKPLTIECYNKIHHLGCEHFAKVNLNAIQVDKENMDKFRSTDCRFFRNLMKDPYKHEDSIQSEKRRRSFILLNTVRLTLINEYKIETETGCKKELSKLSPEIRECLVKKFTSLPYYTSTIDVAEFFEKGNPIYERAIESMEQVKKELRATQESLNLSKPFASIKIIPMCSEPLVHIYYNYANPIEIEEAVNKLIDVYNKKISQLPSDPHQRDVDQNELALKYIAELFQNLEWLHPYVIGQERTDLVLLEKLLMENGFNPSILYYPHFSIFEPLEKWISYLKEGMETWKKERQCEGSDVG